MKQKRKILNDPIYGFINIPGGLSYQLIEHPYFQRLRRIMQLGLTNMVYPGAFHNRFQHALGATHLMTSAIRNIRSKGHKITTAEEQAAINAILLHDIGHGPFSHTLECDIVENLSHEDLSLIFMNKLNEEFDNQLDLAIEIFNDRYHKRFLHQLVSSQLDVDRLDYLMRDSFFTGVSEGVIGYDRIIKMLDVVDDQLVVEAKGIYSIEKFLIARRLMYWQVYLHKTVISAEQLLVRILKRAKELAVAGKDLFSTPSFRVFLYNKIVPEDFAKDERVIDGKTVLNHFAALDDHDIISSIKVWQYHEDKCLSTLCQWLINRNLYKIEVHKYKLESFRIQILRKKAKEKYSIDDNEVRYFVFSDSISNNAYHVNSDRIKILLKTDELVDITEASDVLNVSVLDKNVKKFFLCYPKGM